MMRARSSQSGLMMHEVAMCHQKVLFAKGLITQAVMLPLEQLVLHRMIASVVILASFVEF